jgi:hypothetical protein
MAPQSVSFGVLSRWSALVSHWMGDLKFTISSFSVLYVPAVFAVVSARQSALGQPGGLWPVLLVGNP